MTHYFKLTLLAASLCLLTLAGCRKKSQPADQPAPANGTLYLHIHTHIDTTEVDSGMVAKDATGRRFELDLAQFYISGITLKKADGSTVSAGNVYLLKKIAQEQYLVGSVPSGNYLSVTFNVGVDAAANQTTPASHAPTDALYTQNPSMWFGSTTQGYIFMNLQGKADTSALNNGPVNAPFSYQLGTSSMLKTFTLPDKAFTVAPGQSQLVHIIADYGKLLQGVNFKTQPTATPFSNAAVAAQISNNIQFMFHYE